MDSFDINSSEVMRGSFVVKSEYPQTAECLNSVKFDPPIQCDKDTELVISLTISDGCILTGSAEVTNIRRDNQDINISVQTIQGVVK